MVNQYKSLAIANVLLIIHIKMLKIIFTSIKIKYLIKIQTN
jgi:hypothetical protein